MLYLLHFSKPLGDPDRPRCSAQHYLGWAEDDAVLRRVDEHLRGQSGVAITTYAHRQGITMQLVGLWPGDKTEERRKKVRGHHAESCVICNTRLLQSALEHLAQPQSLS